MAVEIIQGTDRNFPFQIVRKKTQTFFDLTGITGADLKMKFPTEDDPILTIQEGTAGPASRIVVTDALSGQVRIFLNDTDTARLKEGDGQDMEVLIIEDSGGSDPQSSKVQFIGQLDVKPCIFE